MIHSESGCGKYSKGAAGRALGVGHFARATVSDATWMLRPWLIRKPTTPSTPSSARDRVATTTWLIEKRTESRRAWTWNTFSTFPAPEATVLMAGDGVQSTTIDVVPPVRFLIR